MSGHLPEGRIRVKPGNPLGQLRHEWLAMRTEEALEPARPIIDAHHHISTWMAPPYLIEDFQRDLASGHNIVKSVIVDTRSHFDEDAHPALRSLGETRWVAGLGHLGSTEVAAAQIGFVDLSIGEHVGEVVDKHLEVSGGRLRGIRNVVAYHDDPRVHSTIYDTPKGFLATPSVRQGLSHLAQRALSFETWLYHTQLDELTAVAEAFPDMPVIADHLGGPIGIGPYLGQRHEAFAEWRREIARFAALPNARVKFSGIGMSVMGFGFHEGDRPASSVEIAARTRPWFDELLEQFGPDRIMFGSNFPVDKVALSYRLLWNAFKRLAADLSGTERNWLFYDTAAVTYRIGRAQM